MPRSGTNYFLELLENFTYQFTENSFEKLIINNELLDENHFFIDQQYKDHNNIKRLYKLIKTHPLYYYNKIMHIQGNQRNQHLIIVNKIFHYHFNKNISYIINKTPFIIILYRNPIDTYISNLKFNKTNKYKCYDTTQLKIHFNIDDYIHYKEILIKWFNYIKSESIINKTVFVEMYYEKIHGLSFVEQHKYIKTILENHLPQYKFQYKLREPTIYKQDKSIKYKDKILNYEEVKEYINNECSIYNANATNHKDQ